MRQPLNLTLGLLHNIIFIKAGGLSIQKLHKKSKDCVNLLNSPNPVLGQPTMTCIVYHGAQLRSKSGANDDLPCLV